MMEATHKSGKLQIQEFNIVFVQFEHDVIYCVFERFYSPVNYFIGQLEYLYVSNIYF
jgi:hypothetical protein